MKISNREIIIAAIAILVLLGIGYFINQNGDDTTEETSQEDQVNLDENESTDEADKDSGDLPEGVASVEPEQDAEVALANAPSAVTVKAEDDKQLDAGSEIKVTSDKGSDVVTAGNRITADLKTLSAPVRITEAGTYTVDYSINWQDGSKSEGSYKFTVN